MDKEKRNTNRKDPIERGENNKLDTKDSLLEKNQSIKDIKNKVGQTLKKTKSPLKPHKSSIASSLKKKLKNKEESSIPSDKKLSSINEKLKQALNDNLYLRAEFENFKRRSAEERLKLIRYGGEQFISSLANEVLDDLDRATLSAQKEKSFENLKKGLEMIQKKLSQLLHSFGVEILDPTGKAFDSSYQEALSHIKTFKVPEGHVAETIKKAYKFHEKVIRPAQVVLAKKEESTQN